MTVGIVDTTVIVHIFRKNAEAKAWLVAQTNKLSVTSITWLEVMYGAPGKIGQQVCKTILDEFELINLTEDDQTWAMTQMQAYRLSRGIGINDCLIASVCHRLQIPIYTHNVKDMTKILPVARVIHPY